VRLSRLACALCLLLGVPGAGAGLAAPQPTRIVSLNLCTDQVLLALAPRERIAMLSNIAADPLVSWQAREVGALPRFDGSVESVVRLDPDIVLAGTLASRDSVPVLQRLGYRVEMLEMPESIEASLEFIVRTGELIGEAAAARRLRASTMQRLEAVRARWRDTAPLPALVYLPAGISPGAGTLKSELLELSGWENLAALRGIVGYGTLPLEDLVRTPPRLLLFDAVDLAHASLSQQLLHHPVLRERIPARAVPSGLWICGGPQIAEAAELLGRLRAEQPADDCDAGSPGCVARAAD